MVRQAGDVVRMVFGEQDGSLSERGQAIADAFISSGVPAEVHRRHSYRALVQVPVHSHHGGHHHPRPPDAGRAHAPARMAGRGRSLSPGDRGSGSGQRRQLPAPIYTSRRCPISRTISRTCMPPCTTDVMAGRPLELQAFEWRRRPRWPCRRCSHSRQRRYLRDVGTAATGAGIVVFQGPDRRGCRIPPDTLDSGISGRAPLTLPGSALSINRAIEPLFTLEQEDTAMEASMVSHIAICVRGRGSFLWVSTATSSG